MVENRLGRKDVTSVFLLCLKDKYWAVAAKAAIGLCDLGLEPREVVPALAACLSSRTNMPVRSPAGTVDHKPIILEGDDAVRYSAAMALVAYSSSVHSDKSKNHDYRETMRAALPVLVKALSDEDWHVAMLAAVALGYAALEPDVAVPALVKCLNHPQPYVRDSAIRALGDFGEAARAAVPELAKLAQSDPGGYVGGGWASSALKKIIPQTKP
jgi:hypothetical protein